MNDTKDTSVYEDCPKCGNQTILVVMEWNIFGNIEDLADAHVEVTCSCELSDDEQDVVLEDTLFREANKR